MVCLTTNGMKIQSLPYSFSRNLCEVFKMILIVPLLSVHNFYLQTSRKLSVYCFNKNQCGTVFYLIKCLSWLVLIEELCKFMYMSTYDENIQPLIKLEH